MSITVVSSLDLFCRQQSCEMIAATIPGAFVVFHDLLDDGVVIRRVQGPDGLIERRDMVLEHGCLSCTVRLDVVPTVEELLSRGAKNIVLGLPPAVAGDAAVRALHAGVSRAFDVGSVVLACAPGALEDQIWDHHTLFESGFTPVPEDDRTAGEFLIEELAFSDTVMTTDPELIPVDPASRSRGIQLLHEIAPHAAVISDARGFRDDRHDYGQAIQRTMPGTVFPTPAANTQSPFTTVVHRAERPLHPERFRRALGSLAEGCCWLRGHLWIAAAPTCRIAVRGIGPRVWLENTGPWLAEQSKSMHPMDDTNQWHPVFGDRGTLLAVTGEGVDPTELAALLAHCELTDAEMVADRGSFTDPFNLKSTQQPEKGTGR